MVISDLSSVFKQRLQPLEVVVAAAANYAHQKILVILLAAQKGVSIVFDLVDFELFLNLLF